MLHFYIDVITKLDYIFTSNLVVNELDSIFTQTSKGYPFWFDASGLGNGGFIKQFYNDPQNTFNLIDETFSIFYYSVPNITLHYPEPFVATPSTIHYDPWFLHIAIYQYWLWFIFMSLIITFFLIFIITIRKCNIRNTPVRETRGVSRSKCGDLITSSVPITWAISILIHESNDAIENSDGYGTSDFSIGIRAYQWGWEYYYPNNEFTSYSNNTLNSHLCGSYFKDSSWVENNNEFNSDQLNSLKTTDGLNLKFFQILSTRPEMFKNPKVVYHLTGNLINRLRTKTDINVIKLPRILNLDYLYYSQQPALIFSCSSLLNYYRNHIFEQNNLSSFQSINHQCNYYNPNLGLNNLYKYLYYKDTLSIYNDQFYKLSGFYKVTAFFSKLNREFNTDLRTMPLLNNNLPFTPLIDTSYMRWPSWDIIEGVCDSEFIFFSNSGFEKVYNGVILQNLSLWTLNTLNLFKINTLTDFYHYGTSCLYTLNQIKINNNIFKNTNQLNLHWILLDMTGGFSLNKFNIDLIFKSGGANLGLSDSKGAGYINLLDLVKSYTSSGIHTNNPQFIKNKQFLFYITGSLTDVSPIKALSVFERSFFKIFKSSIDESRSLTSTSQYNRSDAELPLLSTKQCLTPAVQTLTKTSNLVNSNYNLIYIKTQKQQNLGDFRFTSIINSVVSNFPFPVSSESDLIRHIWFDWYVFRTSIITKAMDTSKFNLQGTKTLDFNFKNNKILTNINNYDNFLLKYSLNRKLPEIDKSTDYVTYNRFYNFNKVALIYNNQKFDSFTDNIKNNKNKPYNNLQFNIFFEFNKINMELIESIIGLKFMNILQVGHFRGNKGLDFLRSDLKSIYSRRLYLYLLLQKKSFLMDLRLFKINKTLDLNPLQTIMDSRGLGLNNQNISQYKPIRKGITNMIRIHADRAVALPIDTRIQILAVSKDIIHSWSIPSAGVKIDCIPGYSSHRVIVFNLSGLYWGQCMEICGRFHHWMPIVVYFLKRDLFCLWCVHFLHKTGPYKSRREFDRLSNRLHIYKGLNCWFYNF